MCSRAGRPFAETRDFAEHRRLIAPMQDPKLRATAKVQGDVRVLERLASTLVDFDPRSEIMPGTKRKGALVARGNPYEAVPRKSSAE
jgi:hypothetical protein